MKIESLDDAERMVERFNGFHDGFIKRVELVSHDRFDQFGPDFTDRCQVCTGLFDAVLDFAHYNYDRDRQPVDRLVSCRFEAVKGFHLDLRNTELHDWVVNGVRINETSRPGPQGPETALKFHVTRSVLVDGERWEQREEALFSFKRAFVEERRSHENE
jgi:hypothetical protein